MRRLLCSPRARHVEVSRASFQRRPSRSVADRRACHAPSAHVKARRSRSEIRPERTLKLPAAGESIGPCRSGGTPSASYCSFARPPGRRSDRRTREAPRRARGGNGTWGHMTSTIWRPASTRSARSIDRQDKLIARITVSLYDVVEAVRRAGDFAEPATGVRPGSSRRRRPHGATSRSSISSTTPAARSSRADARHAQGPTGAAFTESRENLGSAAEVANLPACYTPARTRGGAAAPPHSSATTSMRCSVPQAAAEPRRHRTAGARRSPSGEPLLARRGERRAEPRAQLLEQRVAGGARRRNVVAVEGDRGRTAPGTRTGRSCPASRGARRSAPSARPS